MTIALDDIQKSSAKYGGIVYLLIIVAGIFAEFAVRSSLLVVGDPAATADNILANEKFFRVGLIGDLVMLVCDATVAIALYFFFKSVNAALSLSALVFRLVHTSILGANLLYHFLALHVLTGASYMAAFDPPQRIALMSLALDLHSYGYLIGLIFFGADCMIVAYLLYISRFAPKILALLISVAAIAYLFEGVVKFAFPEFSSVATTFTITVAPIAELSFCFWLLYFGFKK